MSGTSFTTEELLRSLRYAGGIDFYPQVFQVLLVIFWGIHMFFINLTIGNIISSLVNLWRGRRLPLAKKMVVSQLRTGIITLSLGIVFGVAPLLFTQTIYDELWYTANNLSAWIIVLFVPAIIFAYYAGYLFYLRKKQEPTVLNYFLYIVAIALIIYGAVAMHTFTYEGLFPDKWVDWYTDGGTTMRSDGWHIYAFNIPRFLTFIFLSFFITGLQHMTASWFFKNRTDLEQEVLAYRFRFGKRMALSFGILTLLSWLIYVTLDGWLMHPVIYVLTLFLVLIWLMTVRFARSPQSLWTPVLFALGFVFVEILSVEREAIRVLTLARFNHTIANYPVYFNVLGPILFFGTMVTLGTFLFYVLYGVYKAGRQTGVFDPETNPSSNTVSRGAARLTLILFALWQIAFWSIGLYAVMRS
ncbi:MAG: hypothetical protein RBR24_01145 [Candidatus Carbobacillus sp.]|nr:hypothetical protein [Candidatus Carbobacillus sp.]